MSPKDIKPDDTVKAFCPSDYGFKKFEWVKQPTHIPEPRNQTLYGIEVVGDCCIVSAGSGSPSKEPGLRGVFEQPADEFDLAFDAWVLVMDVSAFDGADCLDAAEGRLG